MSEEKKKLLTEDDFRRAAQALKCETAAIKAVCEVEAPKGGFLDDGRVTILFERHKFHKYTHGAYSKSNPDISSPNAGGYGAAGAHQYTRFSRAFKLDPKAAMMSCSFGKFQIMGFNFGSCGFDSLDAFVDAMKESEGRQLDAFVRIVISFSLADELRRHDWRGFAKGYNGANYAINRYDVKLAAAYRKHLKDKTPAPTPPPEIIGTSVVDDLEDVSDLPTVRDESDQTAEPVETVAGAVKNAPEGTTAPAIAAQPVAVPQARPAENKEPKPSELQTKSRNIAVPAGGLGFLAAVGAWLKSSPTHLILALLGASALIVTVYFVCNLILKDRREKRELELKKQREQQAHELTVLQANSAKSRTENTVVIVPEPIANSDSPKTAE